MTCALLAMGCLICWVAATEYWLTSGPCGPLPSALASISFPFFTNRLGRCVVSTRSRRFSDTTYAPESLWVLKGPLIWGGAG